MSAAPEQSTASRQKSGLIPLAFFGVIMLIGLLLLAWLGSPAAVITVGKPLPELDLKPLTAATPPVTKDSLKGQVTLLHFWGTWTKESRDDYQALQEVLAPYRANDDVKVLSIACSQEAEFDLPELTQRSIDFLGAESENAALYADPAALTRGKLAVILPGGTFAYPTAIVLDRNAVIVALTGGKQFQAGIGQVTQKLDELTR